MSRQRARHARRRLARQRQAPLPGPLRRTSSALVAAVSIAGGLAATSAGPASAAPAAAAPVAAVTAVAPRLHAVTPSGAPAAFRGTLLRYGSRGPAVAYVQRRVGATADGVFGPRTRAAVQRFQRSRGLVADGIVGPRTWRALTGASARASRSASRPSTAARPSAPRNVASLNWAALARCESSGNPRAVNPVGYYGLYQFDVSTWRSVGGSGMPHHASAGEQTYRAQRLYQRRGAQPWPVCGRQLFR